MKRILVFLIALVCAASAVQAQDVIVLRSGESLKAYGVNVGKEFVTYKTEPDAKSRKRIGKAKVFSVKKEFGEMVLITDTLSSLPSSKAGGEIARAVGDGNSGMVAEYNRVHGGCVGKRPGNRATGRAIAIMGVAAGSVLSNEDVDVEIIPHAKKGMRAMQYRILVSNKSDDVIYIDLENTFRIFGDGTSRAYYSSQKVSRTAKSERKVTSARRYYTPEPHGSSKRRRASSDYKVAESRTATVTLSGQPSAKRLAIPAKSKAALPAQLCLSGDDVESLYDYFGMELSREAYPLKAWESLQIDEAASPVKERFVIKYSFDDRFRRYSTVEFTLYLRELIGLGLFTRHVSGDIILNYGNRTIFGKAVLE